MSEIDCSRPQDYTYDGYEVLNIFGPAPSGDYAITFSEGRHWCTMLSRPKCLKKKPVFEPVLGCWYQFSNYEDFNYPHLSRFERMEGSKYVSRTPGLIECFFNHCRSIPKEIKDKMVFEGEE